MIAVGGLVYDSVKVNLFFAPKTIMFFSTRSLQPSKIKSYLEGTDKLQTNIMTQKLNHRGRCSENHTEENKPRHHLVLRHKMCILKI